MKIFRLTVLTVAWLLAGAAAASAQTAPAPVPATPGNAAGFVGTWAIEATGSYGPVSIEAEIKTADGKVTGEVTSAATGKSAMRDISRTGSSLTFVYVFDYNGMPITAIATLTPAGTKVDVYLEMADGAATFTGTATKKDVPQAR